MQDIDYKRRMSQILIAKLKRQKGKCHWCSVHIHHTPTKLNELKRKKINIMKITAYILRYKDKENIITINRATIDHLKEKANGGTDTAENLVASCYSCNNKRSRHLNLPKMEYEEDVKVKITKDWEMPSKVYKFHIGEIYQAKYRSNKSVVIKLDVLKHFITLPKGFYHVIEKVSNALPIS